MVLNPLRPPDPTSHRVYGMRRGTAHAPLPPWRTFVGEGRPRPLPSRFVWTLAGPSLLQLCRVQRGLLAQTTICRGDSPRTLWGASFVWPQFRFFPLSGGPWGPVGVRLPVPGRCTGLDRTGTDKGWYSRHSQLQGRQFLTAALGVEFRGWAAAGSFSCTAARCNLSKDGALVGCPPRTGK